MTTRSILLLTAASLAVPSLSACGATDNLDCVDGKCDEDIPASPCDSMFEDESGHGFEKIAGRFNDKAMKLLFREGNCPTTAGEMLEKLKTVDSDGATCKNKTRFISETAQVTGRVPQAYRTVTSASCGGRDNADIMFSQFTSGTASGVPDAAEFIARDEVTGIFNYYEITDNKVHFFGTSKDFAHGEGGRCVGCHTNGALIMKELDSPWIHWTGHEAHPGTGDIIAAVPAFGTESSGIEFEGTVRNANEAYNEKRLAFMKEGENVTEKLLRPLFCNDQVNLANGAQFKSSQLSQIPFRAFLSEEFKSFGGFNITFADYQAQITANGQRLQGVPNVDDSVFDYTFAEKNDEDVDFINKMKAAGIIDEDFIKDVLAVDFTRQIFSNDRCGLLSFAPRLSGTAINAAAVRDGFIENLQAESPAAGSPAAVLLANLMAANDGAAHQAKVDAFVTACNALGSQRFVANALRVTSAQRNKARELPILEFPATLAVDNLNANPESRLHPVTCEVTTSFVAP